jgi:hypothetical protein
MNSVLKKISATLLSLSFLHLVVAPLFVSSPALAVDTAVNLNPCPNSASDSTTALSSPFGSLCSFTTQGTGGILRRSIVAVLIVAALLSLVFLIWGGIKWILSGGDKAKVETARNTIIAAIVGLIIAFLAYFILSVVLNLFGISVDNLDIPNIAGKTTGSGGN